MYLLIFLRQSDREEKAVETMGDREKKRGGKERDRESLPPAGLLFQCPPKAKTRNQELLPFLPY